MTHEEISTKIKDELNKRLEGVTEVLSVELVPMEDAPGWLVQTIFTAPPPPRRMYMNMVMEDPHCLEDAAIFGISVDDTVVQIEICVLGNTRACAALFTEAKKQGLLPEDHDAYLGGPRAP